MARLGFSVTAALAGTLVCGCVHLPKRAALVPQPLAGSEAPGVTNNYGQTELPEGSLIALEGDDLAYSGDPAGGRREGTNGSAVARNRTTVGRSLQKLLAASQGRVEVAERGYPGDTLAAGLKRWADAPVPDLLVLGYGYGDALAATPAATFQADLTAAVAQALAAHEYVVLLVYPAVKDPKLNAELEPYRAATRAVAAAQRTILVEGEAARGRLRAPAAGVDLRAEVYRQIAADIAARIAVVAAPADPRAAPS